MHNAVMIYPDKKGGPGTSGKVPGFMKKKKNSVRLIYIRYYEVSYLFLNFDYSIKVSCDRGVKQK